VDDEVEDEVADEEEDEDEGAHSYEKYTAVEGHSLSKTRERSRYMQ
jgi:hypothetical protein